MQATPNPKLIVFDFDGTLADTFEIAFRITNHLSSQFKFKTLKRCELDHLREKGWQELRKHLGIPLLKVPMILAQGRKLFRQHTPRVKPFSDIRETLIALKNQGHHLGILTSNSVENVRAFLKKHDLDLFHFVTTSGLTGKDRLLKTHIKRHRYDPNHVYYVGDETRDIEAAKGADVRSIAVSWGFNTPTALSSLRPDHLVNHPRELLQVITPSSITGFSASA